MITESKSKSETKSQVQRNWDKVEIGSSVYIHIFPVFHQSNFNHNPGHRAFPGHYGIICNAEDNINPNEPFDNKLAKSRSNSGWNQVKSESKYTGEQDKSKVSEKWSRD